MEFRFTVQTKIRKPLNEVFDAVYNPSKLSGYFTTGGSDGPLDEGGTVLWTFDDTGSQPMIVPVKATKTVKNSLVRFSWAASEGVYDPITGSVPHPGGYDTVVEMNFKALGPQETLVKIVEGTWRSTDEGLQGSYGNCQGWMDMSCCLKAFLEYGINLRKGSF
jgi:uncharacterized protein YndB with AHSA1/START domain